MKRRGDGQGWIQQTLGNFKEDISVHEEANERVEQNLFWVNAVNGQCFSNVELKLEGARAEQGQ